MRLPFRPRWSWTFDAILAVALAAPAWIVRYPPIQDLPFHLAAMRVIHSFHDPAYGFDRDFVLQLGQTQYIVYYLIGSLLAYPLGILKANVVLMSFYLAGTPFALRSLLRALGKDERLSLLAIPLLPNVMFMFGLLPFLFGIPIMFWALAGAVAYFEKPTVKQGVVVAILALVLFYSHVFPFGIFVMGYAVMFPWGNPRQWLRAGLPAVPVSLTFGWWTFFTTAGKLTRGSVTDNTKDPIAPIPNALNDVPKWLVDVFHDSSDTMMLVGFMLVILVAFGLSQGDKDRSKPISRWYGLLPPACAVLYFVLPEGHGYIWLIAQRFPLLFMLTFIPLVRMPAGFRGHFVTALMLSLGAVSVINTCQHFIVFQLREVGDFDEALDAIPAQKRVAALIYDKGSAITNWAPFLHFGSYYQVVKGGVVEFTYAGYAHWPFDFRPGHAPPSGSPARLRWEWMPESVSVQGELVPYFEYVLTRGGGFYPGDAFHLKWKGQNWAVWENARLPH
jgi:hypothetical protein